MNEPNIYRNKLKKILDEREFDKLKELCFPEILKEMKVHEREFLGLSLVRWGETLLEKDDQKALEVFSLALRAAPHSVDVILQQGISWFDYAKKVCNPKGLKKAESSFKAVLKLYPCSFDASLYLANVFAYLGVIYQSGEYFRKAREGYSKAYDLCGESADDRGRLFWQWGRFYYFMGKNSGEAVDFHQAVSKFERIKEEESPSPLFWNDYANAFVELGCLLGKTEMFQRALCLYEKGIFYSPENFEIHLNIACTAQRLYYITSNNDYVSKAEEYFHLAASIDPKNLNLWIKWGELLLTIGKIGSSVQWIKDGLEKFIKADKQKGDYPLVLNRWAEGLIILGSLQKDFSLISQGEKKILRSLSINAKNPDTWYVYGLCLNELGNYFEHAGYYEDAIEKFHYGLSLDKRHPLIWYGLAMSYFFLSESKEDLSILQQSLVCFNEVKETGLDLSQLWSNWGIALMKMGEMKNQKEYIETAIEKFEKSFRLHRGERLDTETLYHFGCAFDILGDFYEEESYYEKAIQILSYVLTLDPAYSHARYNLALSLSHLGELMREEECFYRANEYFKSLIEADEEDEMSWNEWGLSLLNLAQLFYEKSEVRFFHKYCEDAVNKLKHAASLGSVQAYYPLACASSMMGCYDEAMYFVQRAENFEVLPTVKDMMRDEWLGGLRETESFRKFVTELSSKSSKKEENA